jgi:c-di-GMP-binding flagellar brake protein YcgR
VRLGKDKETAIDVAGLEFIDINENNRDKIIQFIFERIVANRKLFR